MAEQARIGLLAPDQPQPDQSVALIPVDYDPFGQPLPLATSPDIQPGGGGHPTRLTVRPERPTPPLEQQRPDGAVDLQPVDYDPYGPTGTAAPPAATGASLSALRSGDPYLAQAEDIAGTGGPVERQNMPWPQPYPASPLGQGMAERLGQQVEAQKPALVPYVAGRLARGAIDPFLVPHDAMTGELDLESDEGIRRVMGIPFAMYGARLPGPKELLSGERRFATVDELGTLGGRGAKTANLEKLARAEQMEAAGTQPADIWQQTGWRRGAGGEWQFEIPDQGLKITPPRRVPAPGTRRGYREYQGRIEHPDLEAAYPGITKIPFRPVPQNMFGQSAEYKASYRAPFKSGFGEEFELQPHITGEEARNSMVHELQHAVQEREKLPQGSSPNAPYIREMASDLVAFKKQHAQDAINSIRDQRDRWVDQQTTGTPEQQLTSSIRAIPAFSDLERRFFEENPQLKEEMDAAREYLDMPERMRLYEARHGLYHRVAGEAEARNVQSRLYMPPEERQRTLPEEDVPREEQIVVRDNQVKGLGTPGKKPPAGNVERFENVVTDEMERRFGPLKRPERQESRKPYGEEGKGRYAERQGPPPPNAPQPYPSGINWDRTTVGEGNIPVGKGQRVIDVDPKALDRALRMTDPEMYELIPGRMERLKSHVDEGKPVSMADVSVSEDGKRVSFTNGRTRTRLAAEHGDKSMPVVVDAEQAGKLQALVRKYAKPRADEVVRQREPFVNKYRESARVPKDVPEHDWSKPTGVPWYDQWGQPGAPEPPSYTAYDPVMTADLAAEEAAARRAGEDRQASYEFGGEPGKPANVNTSQKEIIENLPPPLSLSERTWRNYASRMTPDEMMHSEAVWGGARRIAEETGMPESEAFAQLLNDMWGRAGANRHITPAQARRFMGQERGIRAVEDAGDRQASYEELPREIPSAAGKVTRGHNMPPDEEPLPQERGRRPATPEEAKLRTPETSAPMRGEPATPEAKAVSDTPRHEPLGSNRNEVALTARELHDPSTPKMKAGSRNKEAVARQLELRGARALRALGVRGKLTGPSKHDEMLARVIATEIKDEMARGVASGKRVAHDWYTTKIEEAIGIASAIHPEIATDPIARMAFSAGLAITSQGEKVGMNVRHAMRVYERYKETGRFPTNIKAEKQLFMNSSFKKLNELIKRLGPDGARDFLSRQFTVRELEAASGYKITGENKDTLVNGSAIFGPKIGQGFYQNLTGNFDPVTMDLWFMRGWGRLTNTLTRGAAELQAPLERMRKAMVAARMRPPKDDKELIAKSRAIAAAFERDFAANRKLYDSGKKKKSELVAAAQRVDVNAGGINEQPGSGGRRTWMRAIVNRARELLANEGINITNADLQAIWWYPEKELYAKLGVRGKLEDLNVDYASALRDHARKMGVSDGEIDEALRKLRASSGRPGPGRGADERRGDRTAR